MFNRQISIGHISVEPGNKTTPERELAAEMVSFEIAYPCFIKAVTSILLINFTTMAFLEHTKSLSDFGVE